MIHKMLADSETECRNIQRGEVTARIFLANFCPKEFQAGDKIIICFPALDDPVGVVEISEVHTCDFLGLDFPRDAAPAGFSGFGDLSQHFRGIYSGVQLTDMLIVVKWRQFEPARPCTECDDRDQT